MQKKFDTVIIRAAVPAYIVSEEPLPGDLHSKLFTLSTFAIDNVPSHLLLVHNADKLQGHLIKEMHTITGLNYPKILVKQNA